MGPARPIIRFEDRVQAGRALARRLDAYVSVPGVIVLGLPRGGVPVAAEVAQALHAPLDVWIVRKLGVPDYEEYAMGAISRGGTVRIDHDVVRSLAIPRAAVEAVVARERAELERRERVYRRDCRPPELAGRAVIVVDDGLATGASMHAAVHALRSHGPARIVVAVPVGSAEACAQLGSVADECVCAALPEPFQAVGLWYRDFAQTSDEEVLACLDRLADRPPRREGST